MVNDWFTTPHAFTPDNSPRPAEALLEDEDNLQCFTEKKDDQYQLES